MKGTTNVAHECELGHPRIIARGGLITNCLGARYLSLNGDSAGAGYLLHNLCPYALLSPRDRDWDPCALMEKFRVRAVSKLRRRCAITPRSGIYLLLTLAFERPAPESFRPGSLLGWPFSLCQYWPWPVRGRWL